MRKIKTITLISIITIVVLIMATNISHGYEEKTNLKTSIQNITNPITNTFTYKVEPIGEKIAPEFNQPKEIKIEFSNQNPENNEISKEEIIDFSSVSYSTVGTYKYKVTEVSSSDEKTFPISKKEYTIYVQVLFEGDGLIKNVVAEENETKEKGKMEFRHEPQLTSITLENKAQGKLASDNEYFKFKIKIMGNIGDTYQVLGQDPTITFEDEVIDTQSTYTVKSGEENYMYIYLKANQIVTIGKTIDGINQIPVGIKYTISRQGSMKWNTTFNAEETQEIEKTTSLDENENRILIINGRDFDVAVTGVFLKVVPFAILFAIGIIGAIYMILKPKKKDVDE